MPVHLDRTQRRILGVLAEKAFVTPDQYPLTLNALVLGCNQKSSREPIMDLKTFEIEGALKSLQVDGWVTKEVREGGRTIRWTHRLDAKIGLERSELALIAVLMLRGAQTPVELKTRTERMVQFATPEAVVEVLDRLAARPQPLVRRLSRTAGERAERWQHLLTPPAEAPEPEPAPARAAPPARSTGVPPASREDGELRERIERLEAEVQDLRDELERLRSELTGA